MNKRGDIARENVKNTIIKAFSDTNSYLGVQDKKIYVQAKDGETGETIQFAISMTMPKTGFAGEVPQSVSKQAEESIWEGSKSIEPERPQLSETDRTKIEELKNLLGVID